MSDNLLVSVITPCYNSGKTIEKTLQCIENQTYKNIEYIIIDGDSTDKTLNIINSHKTKLPPNLKVISEKDGGIYEAMNKGIGLASGKLVGIVNSDDWYEYDTVEQAVNAYKGNKYEVVYGMQRNYKDNLEKSIILYRHEFLCEQNINHPTCFVTKDTYSDLGLFDTNYRSAADYDLMLRFWESKKVTFTPIMRVLSNFQMGGMSGSQTGVRENAKIRCKHGYMGRKKYCFVVIKSHIYEMFYKNKYQK
jgi:glycosyltransferase involved in cell wall biosynthesis